MLRTTNNQTQLQLSNANPKDNAYKLSLNYHI